MRFVAEPARDVTVAESSSIEAPVSSDEAAFCCEIAESEFIESDTTFLEDTQVSAPEEMLFTPLTVSLISESISFTETRVSPKASCWSRFPFLTSSEASTAASLCSRRISICFLISSAIAFESSASLPISSATTANPLPASPALAASIEALSERRFVCVAILAIPSTFSFMLETAS